MARLSLRQARLRDHQVTVHALGRLLTEGAARDGWAAAGAPLWLSAEADAAQRRLEAAVEGEEDLAAAVLLAR
jgi:hypothetical protein